MRTLLTYLPAAGCLLMMAVICIPMMRGHGKQQDHHQEQAPSDALNEIAALREEISELKASLALREEKERSLG